MTTTTTTKDWKKKNGIKSRIKKSNKRKEPIVLLPSIKLYFWYHASLHTLASNFVENFQQRSETKMFICSAHTDMKIQKYRDRDIEIERERYVATTLMDRLRRWRGTKPQCWALVPAGPCLMRVQHLQQEQGSFCRSIWKLSSEISPEEGEDPVVQIVESCMLGKQEVLHTLRHRLALPKICISIPAFSIGHNWWEASKKTPQILSVARDDK